MPLAPTLDSCVRRDDGGGDHGLCVSLNMHALAPTLDSCVRRNDGEGDQGLCVSLNMQAPGPYLGFLRSQGWRRGWPRLVCILEYASPWPLPWIPAFAGM